MKHPDCPYCGERSRFMKSSLSLYGFDYGPVYVCTPCEAWVGCHPNTNKPLGRLADAKLRKAKQGAHKYFDALWRAKIKKEGCSKGVARRAGYKWLSKQLGISKANCHIGMFDVETCNRVEELCKQF